MNIKEALLKGTEILKQAHIETPVLDAGVILCHVLGCDKVFLFTHDQDILKDQTESNFFKHIGERANGKPVNYITGKREFMSLDFKVNDSVLIPRPDTEILVEHVINHFNTKGNLSSKTILEIGTGSGCIAICLAYYIKQSKVTTCDISLDALNTAKENALRNGVIDSITFLESNVYANVDIIEKFDAIVSNPPYIPKHELPELQREVRDFEPITALDGGVDGLDFYRQIIDGARNYLRSGGLAVFEVGYNQANEVKTLMVEKFQNICLIKDLSGINRVVSGILK